MFINDKLIYIQLQKTGGTHIAKLLSKIFDGEQVGSHNAASINQINSDKYFVSSIRNPWDWYLSLWTYGVQGKGGVMSRLTKKNRRIELMQKLESPMTKTENVQKKLDKVTRNVKLWCHLYKDNSNAESFRKWLEFIHDPNNAELIGEGYGDSNIARQCGFMSYRYLKLCCTEFNSSNYSNPTSNHLDLVNFERKNCYIDFFIRQESLEEDLCKVIDKIKTITKREKDLIWNAKKTNTSKRPYSLSYYYDKDSINLVYSRDKLLINKFGYEFPY